MTNAMPVMKFSVDGRDRFSQLEVFRMMAEGKANPLSNRQFFEKVVLVEPTRREHVSCLPSATSTIGIVEGFDEKSQVRKPFGETVVCRFDGETTNVVFPVPPQYRGKTGLLMLEGLGEGGKPTFELKAEGNGLLVAVKTEIQLFTNIPREWRQVNEQGMPIGGGLTGKDDEARIGALNLGKDAYIGPIIRGFYHGAEDQGFDCRTVDVVLGRRGGTIFSVLQLVTGEVSTSRRYVQTPGIQVLEGGSIIIASKGWKASPEISREFDAALERAKGTIANKPGNANMIEAILMDATAVGINSEHIRLLNELQ